MENYENLYKNALERARVWKEKSGMPADKQGILDDIFPELAGSEDEQIRKRIIHALHGDVLDMEETNKAIAWLEKQGEVESDNDDIEAEEKGIRKAFNKIEDEKQGKQKPAIEMKTPEESLGINSDIYNEIVDECIYGKQKSQRMISAEAKEAMYDKPADKVESKFKVKYAGSEYNVFETKEIAGVTFYGIEDEPNHIDYIKAENCEIISGGYGIKENGCSFPTNPIIFSEQKPAWSEEDEKTIHNIDAAIRHEVVFPIDELKSMEIWLESLKYRVCPKHEWKRDEKMFQLIEDVIDVYRKTQGSVIGGIHTEELKDYLKSLRPQNTWKPSDEQMTDLWDMICECRPADLQLLLDIYYGLKK